MTVRRLEGCYSFNYKIETRMDVQHSIHVQSAAEAAAVLPQRKALTRLKLWKTSIPTTWLPGVPKLQETGAAD